MRKVLFAALLLAAACEQGKSKLDKNIPAVTQPTTGSAGSGSATAAKDDAINIDSKDILDRKEASDHVFVKHVLVSWDKLDKVFQGRQDPRGQKRTNADAAKLAQEIAAKLKKDPDSIDKVVQEHSEDPGSLTGDAYEVKADAQFVPEFKALALHLNLKEVGIVRTRFGYHIMERVPPPPPDPLESADILARPAKGKDAVIQHIVIGWKDTQASRSGRGDPRAKERTKADADKLVQEVVAKAKGGDMAALMKEYSEDAQSKDSGRTIPMSESDPIPPPFENLKNIALRLDMAEIGVVKSPMGWHIVKRVPPPPPPPPDALESADILKREPVTQKAKVKHILLGWKDNNGGGDDPRGKARDRATLEKLVKETVAKLKKGDKIEPLMQELSEDPGSKGGTHYDVEPNSQWVEGFKNLGLRLNKGEVGVVKSDFGMHIMQRIE